MTTTAAYRSPCDGWPDDVPFEEWTRMTWDEWLAQPNVLVPPADATAEEQAAADGVYRGALWRLRTGEDTREQALRSMTEQLHHQGTGVDLAAYYGARLAIMPRDPDPGTHVELPEASDLGPYLVELGFDPEPDGFFEDDVEAAVEAWCAEYIEEYDATHPPEETDAPEAGAATVREIYEQLDRGQAANLAGTRDMSSGGETGAGAQVIAHPTRTLPVPGDEAQNITTGWKLHSPIARVVLWGKRSDSPVDVFLHDGTRIRFDAATQLHKVDELCGVLLSQTGGKTVGPTDGRRADLLRLRAAVVRMAEVQAEYDDDSETHEWLQRFLASGGGQVENEWTLTEPASRYALLREMHAARYDPHSGTSPLIAVDHVTGETLLRTTDLRLYVNRTLGENLSAHALASRMRRAGIERREVQAWPPGYGRTERANDAQAKRKLSLYVIPAPATNGDA